MRTNTLLTLLKSNYKTLLLGGLLTGAVAFGASFLQPPRYSAQASLFLYPAGLQQSQDFAFDRFYTLQASQKLTAVLAAFIKSPVLVADLLKEAGSLPANTSVRSLHRFFTVNVRSPQTISVSYWTNDPGKAQVIFDLLVPKIKERLTLVQPPAERLTNYALAAAGPLVGPANNNPVWLGLAGFLLGTILAGVFIIYREQSGTGRLK